MKKLYFNAMCIALWFSLSIINAQNLEWIQPAPTGTGNATIAIYPGITLNESAVTTVGSLIGVFFENESGNLSCAGYTELDQNYIDGNATYIAAWGTDPGEDNGLSTGEEMLFYLNVNGLDYSSNTINLIDPMTQAAVTNSFAPNGLYGLSADFGGDEEPATLEPCSCSDGIEGSLVSGVFCILPSGTNYCSDPASDNYCNTDGLTVYVGTSPGSENCLYGAVLGCACENADNFDPNATVDDGSCIINIGCSNPLADNYSLEGCGNVSIENENCIISGCICPFAANFDETANTDDGTCIAISPICTDPTASNFDQGCENTNTQFTTEDCEYGGCIVENIEWEYTITDANMTIQISSEVVTLNGENVPNGSLIGAFFTNDDGDLQCAGYLEWTGDQLAIPVFASESGLDNGFVSGEEITWLLKVGYETLSSQNIIMNSTPPFSTSFIGNGFGQILSASFACELSGVTGCTDSSSYNYNENATIDDGSCYNLDWDVTITDCNMTILIQALQNISLNNEDIPVGAIIGLFYENEDGQLVCGGSMEWTGTTGSVAAFGDDANSSEIDGFQVGESLYTWLLLIGEQVISMDQNGATLSTMMPFSDVFGCNDFGELLTVNFEGEYTLTYGCTDSNACNYDDSAIMDDNSCTYGQTWYADSDGDGLGNPNSTIESCDQQPGFVSNGDDPCPDTENNPNNVTIWYFDGDQDGLGDIINGSPVFTIAGCNYPGDEFADNLDDPCPNDPTNSDIDGDGICDIDDDCVGQLDAIGVCNGNCEADQDSDLICDNIDTCVGALDECGVCNGPGDIYECGCSDIPEGDCDCNGSILDALGVCGGDCEADQDDDLICDNIDECVGQLDAIGECNGNCEADQDSDLICDNIDTCVGALDECGVCNGPGEIYECGCNDVPEGDCDCNGSVSDVLGVCGGDCEADQDGDLVCDTDDDCVGALDNCGVCNGPGEIYECGCSDIPEGDCDCNGSILDAIGVCGGDCEADQDGDLVCDTDEIIGCTDPLACNFDSEATDECNEIIELNGFTYLDSFEGHNYYISNTKSTTWNEANNLCSETNGYLVSINSEEENNFIVASLLESGNTYSPAIWIGLFQNNEGIANETYVNDSGDWEWTDGTTLNCENNCDENSNWSSYANWNQSEPSNGNLELNEQYGNFWIGVPDLDGNIDADGLWNDCIDECFTQGTDNQSEDGVFFVLEISSTNTCCTYPEEGTSCDGCTDPNADNYNANAINDDGSCEFLGCTDPTACNYDENANVDDQSCIMPINWYLDTDGDGLGFDSGVAGVFNYNGCEAQEGYVSNGDDPNEGDYDNDFVFTENDCDDTDPAIGSAEEGYDCNGSCLNDDDQDGICNEYEIYGCNDESACNYDEEATELDNSCIYAIEFYDCNFICINDSDGDLICDELEVPGCTDESACNFNEDATNEDDSCYYADNNANCSGDCLDGYVDINGECMNIIEGCTDENACNYDETANVDDNSCTYPILEFYDCNNNCINDEDGDFICDELEVLDCMNPIACNFNPLATDSDSALCVFAEQECEECENGQVIINDIDNDGICDDNEILGCTDADACNFNEDATDDDGSCIINDIDIVEINSIPTSCELICDGSISIDVIGGEEPYEIIYTLLEAGESTVANQEFINACFGSYSILVVDSNGCEYLTSTNVDTEMFDENGNGSCDDINLSEFETLRFNVYPNPFNSYTNIELNNPNKTPYSIYLYDTKGTVVKSFINRIDNEIILEKEFTNGIYHLQLISTEGNSRKLIIVE